MEAPFVRMAVAGEGAGLGIAVGARAAVYGVDVEDCERVAALGRGGGRGGWDGDEDAAFEVPVYGLSGGGGFSRGVVIVGFGEGA